MQFDGVALKPWLVRTLEPICDAEPGALADYILALLKHNVPEVDMRKELAVQLEEFLEKEGKPFIDTLFTALRTQSYMPYSASTAEYPEGAITIPPPSTDASPGRTRKRSLDNDERDGRPPKGPRLSAEGNFPRANGWNGRGYQDRDQPGYVEQNGRRNPQAYAPPQEKRGICRDYYNSGYCSRGAYCKFSHGEDAVLPGQLFPMNGAPFMPMFGNGFGMNGAGPAYSPHDAQMGPSNGAGGMMQRSGELPVIQDLTPIDPSNPPQNPPNLSMPPENFNNGAPMDVDMSQRGGVPFGPPPFRGRGGGGGGGRNKGVFNGEVHKFTGDQRRNDKTLVVEKIPQDKLSLSEVNDWFKRFGTVTNVAIDPSTAKALVSFSNHDEARTAWKSEDAVFNNRFVKVFWHRPMEGQGQTGARMLAASAPIVANANAPPKPEAAPTPAVRPVATPRKAPAAATALAAKQQLLEKQIAEQKSLMASLDAASPEEKKEIMAKLRKLGEEMKAAPAAAAVVPKTENVALKERLDKELDLHKGAEDDAMEGTETTEDLKAKLERLKAEAASLGLSEGGAEPTTSWGAPFRGGYRGRGRGARSFYRGAGYARGGPPRASMKLDNRPKKLLVKGVKEDGVQAVQDWYETTGQVQSVAPVDDGSGDILVSFFSRAAAEQGLAKGQNISLVGPVNVSWYTGSEGTSSAPSGAPSKTEIEPDASEAAPEREPEEEIAASGWGDGGDDDGMGMP
ncbi:hypothetical protein MKEN_00779900 [Mycena kentingensis (nom. inval.)]|nr:hypothetical protein MKEN_00779900 [Mycena kentingensis (nom. inval.)]